MRCQSERTATMWQAPSHSASRLSRANQPNQWIALSFPIAANKWTRVFNLRPPRHKCRLQRWIPVRSRWVMAMVRIRIRTVIPKWCKSWLSSGCHWRTLQTSRTQQMSALFLALRLIIPCLVFLIIFRLLTKKCWRKTMRKTTLVNMWTCFFLIYLFKVWINGLKNREGSEMENLWN